jgi:hypothetical protein
VQLAVIQLPEAKMKKTLLVLSWTIMIGLNGCRSTKEAYQDSSSAGTWSGTIFVAGNEPFTKLMLNSADAGTYELKADSLIYRQLWQLQNTQIEVSGTVLASPFGKVLTVQTYRLH